ncbi:class I SAM-dependent methyltransferase [Miltoncostaea marina]|uniref:class I SAM-dependent methyltransferase n=1 Tax=Miltoncostaea marina TaxID=2843215 RepID=UPI001C3E7358|nr:class I SAM-dependent methyltransferase [Miltoncostaea marina]
MSGGRRTPAWARLMLHSHRLGWRWIARAARARRGGGHVRGALYRVLVPLEPWRFHELGRVADERFCGACLDVSSPKLLASLLNAEGQGRWTGIDLLEDEIELWRALDPALDLRVADARRLPFADAAFDAVACVSVIEHIPGDGDVRAMAEIWRVLRPGGVLHLTTNVAARPAEVRTPRPVYAAAGAATPAEGDADDGRAGAFFERRYGPATLDARLLGLPWREEAREYVRERRPVHARFFGARPLSFLAGNLLPLVAARNVIPIGGPAEVGGAPFGVVYLRLRKPD